MHEIVPMPFGQGPPIQVAIVRGDVTPDVVETLVGLGVDGISLDLGTGRSTASLDWLTTFDRLRYLALIGDTCPPIPLSVLNGVEDLTIACSRTAEPLRPGSLESVTVLEVPARILDGALSEGPVLELLVLRSFPFDDFSVMDGCRSLRDARLNGRGRRVAFRWNDPPEALEELQTSGLWPQTLEGIDGARALRRLAVSIGKPREREVPLDLTPLTGCAHLEWLAMGNVGPYVNERALAALPALHTIHGPEDTSRGSEDNP